ncbi:uncharacterized protein ARMOST_20879 [Armillaria ostoyae]|uniref:Uncharacterized protein n=1 Tax=Armillaria ostoyae TaxID=47428 RepID=A0A284S8I3_ARMOS|nr:uncharacterized protein ARMOST_20879 [Armillaria ostoyae]
MPCPNQAPAPGASRRAIRKLYDCEDPRALATLLASRGREVPTGILPSKRPVEIMPRDEEETSRHRRRVYSDNSDNGHGTQLSAVELVQPTGMDKMNTPPPSPTIERSSSPSALSPGHTQASPAPIADSRHPNNSYDAPTIGIDSEIDEVRIAAQFIDELKSVTLEGSNMQPDDISRLREASPELPFDIDDPDFLFALRTFFTTTNASEEMYKSFLFAYKER